MNLNNRLYGALDKVKIHQLIQHFSSTSVSEEVLLKRKIKCGVKTTHQVETHEEARFSRPWTYTAGCLRQYHKGLDHGLPRRDSNSIRSEKRFVGDCKHSDSQPKNEQPKAPEKIDSGASKHIKRSQNFVRPASSTHLNDKKTSISTNGVNPSSSETLLPSKITSSYKSDTVFPLPKLHSIAKDLEKTPSILSLPPIKKNKSDEISMLPKINKDFEDKVNQFQSSLSTEPLNKLHTQFTSKPPLEMDSKKFDHSKNPGLQRKAEPKDKGIVKKAPFNQSHITGTSLKQVTATNTIQQNITSQRAIDKPKIKIDNGLKKEKPTNPSPPPNKQRLVSSSTPVKSEHGLKKEKLTSEKQTVKKQTISDNMPVNIEHGIKKEQSILQKSSSSQLTMPEDIPVKIENSLTKEKQNIFLTEKLSVKQSHNLSGKAIPQGIANLSSDIQGSVSTTANEAPQKKLDTKISKPGLMKSEESKKANSKIKHFVWPPLYSAKVGEKQYQDKHNNSILKKKIHTYTKNIDLKIKMEQPAFSMGRIFGILGKNLSNMKTNNEPVTIRVKPKTPTKPKHRVANLKEKNITTVNMKSIVRPKIPMTAPVQHNNTKALTQPKDRNINLVSDANSAVRNPKFFDIKEYLDENKAKLRSTIKKFLESQDKYLTTNLKGQISEWKQASTVQKKIEETKSRLRKSVAEKAKYSLTSPRKGSIIKRKKFIKPKITTIPLTKALLQNDSLVSEKSHNVPKSELRNSESENQSADVTAVMTKKYNINILKTLPAKSTVSIKTFKDFVKQKEMEKIKEKFDQAIIPVMQRNLEKELSETKQNEISSPAKENTNLNYDVSLLIPNKNYQPIKPRLMFDVQFPNKKQFLKSDRMALGNHRPESKTMYTCYPSGCLKKPELLIDKCSKDIDYDSPSKTESQMGCPKSIQLTVDSNRHFEEATKGIERTKPAEDENKRKESDFRLTNEFVKSCSINNEGGSSVESSGKVNEIQGEGHCSMKLSSTISSLGKSRQDEMSPLDQEHCMTFQKGDLNDIDTLSAKLSTELMQDANVESGSQTDLHGKGVEINSCKENTPLTDTKHVANFNDSNIGSVNSQNTNKLVEWNKSPLDEDHEMEWREPDVVNSIPKPLNRGPMALEEQQNIKDPNKVSDKLKQGDNATFKSLVNKLIKEKGLESKIKPPIEPVMNVSSGKESLSSDSPLKISSRVVDGQGISEVSNAKDNLHSKEKVGGNEIRIPDKTDRESIAMLPNHKNFLKKVKTSSEEEVHTKQFNSNEYDKYLFTSLANSALPKKKDSSFYNVMSKFINELFEPESGEKPNLQAGTSASKDPRSIELNRCHEGSSSVTNVGSLTSYQGELKGIGRPSNKCHDKDISAALKSKQQSESNSGLFGFFSDIFSFAKTENERIMPVKVTDSRSKEKSELIGKSNDEFVRNIDCGPSSSDHMDKLVKHKGSFREKQADFIGSQGELEGSLAVGQNHLDMEEFAVPRVVRNRKSFEKLEEQKENNEVYNEGYVVGNTFPRDVEGSSSSTRHVVGQRPKSKSIKTVKTTESSEEILNTSTPNTIFKSRHTRNSVKEEEYETIKTFRVETNSKVTSNKSGDEFLKSLSDIRLRANDEAGFSLNEKKDSQLHFSSQTVGKNKSPQISLSNAFHMRHNEDLPKNPSGKGLIEGFEILTKGEGKLKTLSASSKDLNTNNEAVEKQANNHNLISTTIESKPLKSSDHQETSRPDSAVLNSRKDHVPNLNQGSLGGEGIEEGTGGIEAFHKDPLLVALKNLCSQYEGGMYNSKSKVQASSMKFEPQIKKTPPDFIDAWEPSKCIYTDSFSTKPFSLPKKKKGTDKLKINCLKPRVKLKREKGIPNPKPSKFTFLSKRKEDNKERILQLKDLPLKKSKRDSDIFIEILKPRDNILSIIEWDNKSPNSQLKNPESYWNKGKKEYDPDDVIRYIRAKK